MVDEEGETNARCTFSESKKATEVLSSSSNLFAWSQPLERNIQRSMPHLVFCHASDSCVLYVEFSTLMDEINAISEEVFQEVGVMSALGLG